jgi:hypothetical protein
VIMALCGRNARSALPRASKQSSFFGIKVRPD